MISETKTLEIEFPESNWTLKIQARGNILGLGLHWGNKDSPTHFKPLSGDEAQRFREFFNASNREERLPSRFVPNKG